MHLGVEKEGKKITRFWDRSREAFCVKVLPGEYYYTTENEYIATTLGSCVAACIWDEANHVGGMNHFMLPLTNKDQKSVTWGNMPTDATRYGNFAMEFLINEILKHGGNKRNFKVKLFGGGKVLEGLGNIGQKNVEFVLDYVKTEGLNLVAQDLGDVYPRKVLFDPLTGKAWMKRIKDTSDTTLAAREKEYQKSIEAETQAGGDVDLF